jgi:hypothetical protein
VGTKMMNKAFVSFTTLAILMFITVIMVWLFFHLFKYHLTLTVKDTYIFNKYQDLPMTFYSLTDVIELNKIYFFGINKYYVNNIFGEYKNFFNNVNYYLSIFDSDKKICLVNDKFEEGKKCEGLSEYDFGITYPIPLIDGRLTELNFQVKG